MTGLGVLYASKAADSRDWHTIKDRDKTKWMREWYWARGAESAITPGAVPGLRMRISWKPSRTDVGKNINDAGDGFFYTIDMIPRVKERFEWFEVTEVFTTVKAKRIDGAMRSLHGLPGKNSIDFEEFQKDLYRGRPSRVEQRRAADLVIEQIKEKLDKQSYRELLTQYGYGTLVVGLPLWFASHSDDPLRAENALDDFSTRTRLGLEVIKNQALKTRSCPFKNIIVIWDITPCARHQWSEARAAKHDDVNHRSMAYRTLKGLLDKSIPGTLPSDLMDGAYSYLLNVSVETRKKVSSGGPYPHFIEAMKHEVHEHKFEMEGLKGRLKESLGWIYINSTIRLLCFLWIGINSGFKKEISRKISIATHWKLRMIRLKARRYYRESRRRGRMFGAGLGVR